jgi:hypothetical protein
VHKTSGLRDPAAAFPLPNVRDDAGDRRAANRAVAVSAAGLGATGLIELLLAVLTGSVGLLGDAIHNLSDVSTSAVFLGFRLSRRPATERYPWPGAGRGPGRDRDRGGHLGQRGLAGESIRKLIGHGHTTHVGGHRRGRHRHHRQPGRGPQAGRRQAHQPATLVADARHSWLDALSSAGALAGWMRSPQGSRATRSPGWPSPRSSATSDTRFRRCHLPPADGIDPSVITTAETAAVGARRPARPRQSPLDSGPYGSKSKVTGPACPGRRRDRPGSRRRVAQPPEAGSLTDQPRRPQLIITSATAARSARLPP